MALMFCCLDSFDVSESNPIHTIGKFFRTNPFHNCEFVSFHRYEDMKEGFNCFQVGRLSFSIILETVMEIPGLCISSSTKTPTTISEGILQMFRRFHLVSNFLQQSQ
jgi:hypothetical protein